MQQRSMGTLVFVVVAVVSLGGTIASAGFGRGARGRFEEARARLAAECNGAPCGLQTARAPSPVPEFRRATADLASPSPANLARVLERADRIDGARTTVGSLLAATLFDRVADRVEADPSLLGDARLAAAILRSEFASSSRPLEAERLHALAVLANVPSQIPLRTAGLAERTAMQAMSDVNATLGAMEGSALAGDTKACERASEGAEGLAKQVTVGPSICKSAERIVASRDRLRRLQARTRRSAQKRRA
jgi:hypothetical protein